MLSGSSCARNHRRCCANESGCGSSADTLRTCEPLALLLLEQIAFFRRKSLDACEEFAHGLGNGLAPTQRLEAAARHQRVGVGIVHDG